MKTRLCSLTQNNFPKVMSWLNSAMWKRSPAAKPYTLSLILRTQLVKTEYQFPLLSFDLYTSTMTQTHTVNKLFKGEGKTHYNFKALYYFILA